MQLPSYVERLRTSFPTTFTWNSAHEDLEASDVAALAVEPQRARLQ